MPLAGLDDDPPAARGASPMTTGSVASASAPLPLRAEAQKADGRSSPSEVAHTAWLGAKATGGRELSARVSQPPPSFPAALGMEDLRRAHGALALALDPQGNGKDVAWSNPQSGMKGVIIPAGGPYLKAHEICRAFTANTSLQAGAVRQKGVACRPSGGEWSIREMRAASS